MKYSIPRCYDSHVHLLATGQVQSGLQLQALSKIEDLKSLVILPQHFRGQFLVGFGWDQHRFPQGQWPKREDLDQAFPDFPVVFSRIDGHASWLNSQALELSGIASNGHSGILLDNEKIQVDLQLPPYSSEQNQMFMSQGIDYFRSKGFTHIRDMTSNLESWKLLQAMDLNSLQIYIENNFVIENLSDLERGLQHATLARQSQTANLRVAGIKFFLDGALGSEGAYLSQNYFEKANRGSLLWDLAELEKSIAICWQSGFAVSLHSIGDQTAEEISQILIRLKDKGHQGEVHLEHAQLMRSETIRNLSKFAVTCHMQPCHYLSDRRWLQDKLGPLFQYSFRWKEILDAGLKVQWGSDAPIEESGVLRNLEAARLASEAGIPFVDGLGLGLHSHPDVSWGAGQVSHFEI